jgi:hypothetical protein
MQALRIRERTKAELLTADAKSKQRKIAVKSAD